MMLMLLMILLRVMMIWMMQGHKGGFLSATLLTWHSIKHPRFLLEAELETLDRMGRKFFNPLLKPLLQIDAVVNDANMPLTGANTVP